MAKLLYIKASPRGEFSESLKATEAFVRVYKEKNPKDEVAELDIFKKELPTFDGLVVKAKYTILHGLKHTPEELKAWKVVETVIEEFKSADKYLFAIPMWNFGIPYRLKQYFDILIQPGYTFSFSPAEGYKGLVTGKRAAAVYARGGEYKTGTAAAAFDFQKPYIETILGFMGITDICSIVIEPTLAGGPDTAKAKVTDAIQNAKQLAANF